jgi:hypothetical protein
MSCTLLPVGCTTESGKPLEDIWEIVLPIITSATIGARGTVPDITVGVLLLDLGSLLLGGNSGIELLCFVVIVLMIVDDDLECIQHQVA